MDKISETIIDDEGFERVVHFPGAWEICAHCRGRGKSSAYLGAFTRDEMDEQGDEFLDDYMAGNYDRPCDDCHGLGRVLVIDEARMTPEQRADFEIVRENRREIAESRAIERAERAMGA